jgi:fructose-specific phosphotransferase system component IIB
MASADLRRMATASPVKVTYETQGDHPVALRLTDAE